MTAIFLTLSPSNLPKTGAGEKRKVAPKHKLELSSCKRFISHLLPKKVGEQVKAPHEF